MFDVEFDHILLDQHGPLAILTIDRQNQMNALNTEVLSEIAEALERVVEEASIEALMITGAGDKALSMLTGTRVVSVDQNKAIQQRLQDYLKNNPDVQSYQSFFQNDKDPQTQALIKALTEAKKRAKAKREEAANVST